MVEKDKIFFEFSPYEDSPLVYECFIRIISSKPTLNAISASRILSWVSRRFVVHSASFSVTDGFAHISFVSPMSVKDYFPISEFKSYVKSLI